MSDPGAPRGLVAHATPDQVEIVHRWFRGKYLGMLVWLVGFGWAGSQVDPARRADPEFRLVLAAGVVLAYYTLTGIVNRSVIRVTRGGVTVTHGPLPWLRSRYWPAGTFKSLLTPLSPDSPWEDHSVRAANVSLRAELYDGRSATIMSGLARYSQAQFIALTITRFNLAPGGLRES